MKIQLSNRLDNALTAGFEAGDTVKVNKVGNHNGETAEVVDGKWSGRVKVLMDGETKSYFPYELILLKRSSKQGAAVAERDSLSALDGLVTNGSVNLLLHQAFSSDKTVTDAANQRIETFIAEARGVVPLTAGKQRRGSDEERQMHRVAAAKTGLEVALAWMKRITGALDTANGKVFLGGSCNPTTWRSSIAMPMLKKAGVPFYNPQVRHAMIVVTPACCRCMLVVSLLHTLPNEWMLRVFGRSRSGRRT
jgi:hypothetical protein